MRLPSCFLPWSAPPFNNSTILNSLSGGGRRIVMTAYIPTVFNGQIDQLLDEAMRGLSRESAWSPASNVWEDEKGFHVQLALPGWDTKDVSIQVEKQVMTVAGSTHASENDPQRQVYQWEIRQG